MPGRVLLRQKSTGGGESERRMDALEAIINANADDTERGFDVGGKWEIIKAVGNTTVKPWQFVLCDPTAAAFSLLLPDPTLCKLSQVIAKNDTASANAITIRVPNSGTIDGQTTSVINAARQLKQFTSDGREWKESASSGGPLVIQYGTDANTTALPNRLIYMPNQTAAHSVFAPASPTDGMWFRLLVSNAQAFTITVDGNGKNIDDRFGSVTATYVISNNGALLEFVYLATPGTWMIL